MRCVNCNHEDTKVIDSRVAGEGVAIRRRRECVSCSFRFSTYEEMEILDLTVVKRNGVKELYSRDKMERGIRKAFEKRPITEESFKKLISQIEQEIQKTASPEISSPQIGEIVMKKVKKVDKVAYVRFASVYKCFEDIEEFKAELQKL
ncbi:MAG: transcriptional regulator NrdR, transcriptional repressor NrdR [Candidatus Doudnabacteria bacterium]|nr:transcriptional regulator NrdR, transcriptional repressor NrdR [Candidatus Doudnabacteria bacterium]